MSFLKIENKLKRRVFQFESFIETPHLELVNERLKISAFNFPILNVTKSLTSLNIPEKLRFGNRLEYFFEFIINQGNEYSILTKNIQIVKNKITIGELDFILKEIETNKIIHVEIANKFYLYDIIENAHEWIGPNRNDTLVLKIEKLRNKQFPLLQNVETIKKMKLLNITTENIEQRIHFKAQLFYPLNLYSKNRNEKNIFGYYITDNQFFSKEFQNYKYFIPEKRDWQVNPKYGEIWFSYEEIIDKVKLQIANKKSPLIWVKKDNNIREKFFVVWWKKKLNN